jgi:Sortilin, neurotensin receptor 3,
MIRARISIVLTALFLAVTGMMLISAACFSQNLPTNWEVKYVNLKDDLRALAIDPLDPQVIYLGSDIAVISSSDGGDTWTAGQSFRNNKVPVSAADSEEAQEILILIEETGGDGGPAATATSGAGGTEDQLQQDVIEEEISEAKSDADDKADMADIAVEDEKDQEAQLKNAEERVTVADKNLKQAEADLALWTPDTLTAADVDGLTHTSANYMDPADYAQIETWLTERGLGVPTDSHERQDILKTYLSDHLAEGIALTDAVSGAKDELDEAKQLVKDLGDKVSDAKLAAKDAESDEDIAKKDLENTEEELDGIAVGTDAAGIPGAATENGETTTDLDLPDATGVTYIEVDPSSSDKIFLASLNGIYKSGDKGITWDKVYTGINPSQSAGICLAIDPSNPDTVFAGTLSGIAHSADGGVTWDRPGGRVSDKVITRISVHPFDSQIVLAGAAGKGIFKSSDGGSTWVLCFSKASQAANLVLAINFAPSQPQIIYAGTRSGVYKSMDGGESWETAGGMGLGATVEVRDLVVSPTDPDVVYLATRRGVFGTTNGGNQWQRLTFGLTFKGSNFLAFDPLNASTVWLISDNRAFKSTAPRFLDLSSGETMALVGGGEITTDGSERHNILIESVDEANGTATIIIQSDPQTLKLKVGESTDVDVTGNGKDDLVITLDSITDGVPSFSIAKAASATVPPEEKETEEIPPEQITCLEDMDPYFKAEPSWVEVQQAASRWAEVHPDKIAAWRSGASLRAFLPELDFDYGQRRREREDHGTSTSTSYSNSYDRENAASQDDSLNTGQEFETSYTRDGVTDVFMYEQNDDYFTSSEADSSYDRGYGSSIDEDNGVSSGYRDSDEDWWGVGLEWELGDFLYNNEQLRISREARDLVELRQDVLEQVTLYFFNRRTARIDMILNPPADAYSRVEMLLQIQSLDASLDAMTGGYFTNTIKEREKTLKR